MDDQTMLFLIFGVMIVLLSLVLLYSGKKQIKKMEDQIPDIKTALEEGSLNSKAVSEAVENFDEFRQGHKKYMVEFMILIIISLVIPLYITFAEVSNILVYTLVGLLAFFSSYSS